MNNGNPVHRIGNSFGLFFVAAISLISLAAIVALEMRQKLDKPDGSIPLFPGFTADAAPKPATGLVVTSLQSGSEAQLDGIVVGDEVLAIDNHPVGSLDQAEKIIGAHSRDKLMLRILHGDITRDLVFYANGVKRHEP